MKFRNYLEIPVLCLFLLLGPNNKAHSAERGYEIKIDRIGDDDVYIYLEAEGTVHLSDQDSIEIIKARVMGDFIEKASHKIGGYATSSVSVNENGEVEKKTTRVLAGGYVELHNLKYYIDKDESGRILTMFGDVKVNKKKMRARLNAQITDSDNYQTIYKLKKENDKLRALLSEEHSTMMLSKSNREKINSWINEVSEKYRFRVMRYDIEDSQNTAGLYDVNLYIEAILFDYDKYASELASIVGASAYWKDSVKNKHIIYYEVDDSNVAIFDHYFSKLKILVKANNYESEKNLFTSSSHNGMSVIGFIYRIDGSRTDFNYGINDTEGFSIKNVSAGDLPLLNSSIISVQESW